MKAKKYKIALDLFNMVIATSGQTDMEVCLQAWEGRASCFEKLGDLPAARSEAMQLLSAHPKNPRGYLRLGKIYRMEGRTADAERIYNLGLKRIGAGLGSELIKRQLAAMHSSSMRNACIDIAAILPVELVLRIFRYCPWDTIESYSRTSRQAYRLRWKNSHLQRRLLIPNPIVPTAKVLQQSRFLTLDRIRCTNSQGAFEKLFKHLLPRISSLKSLSLISLDLSSSEEWIGKLPTALRKIRLINCRMSPLAIYRLLKMEGFCTIHIRHLILTTGTADDLVRITKHAKPSALERLLLHSAHAGMIWRARSSLLATILGSDAIVNGAFPRDSRIIHVTNDIMEESIKHVGLLIDSIKETGDLQEFAIHQSVFSPGLIIKSRVDPVRVIEAILRQNPRIKLLCLPIFDGHLAIDAQRTIINRYGHRCRIILDGSRSWRLLERLYFK